MKEVEKITLPHDLSEFSEIIDVRSPSEFEIDHFPSAINLPVLTDSERKEIGTLYRENPFEARRIGAAYIANNAAKFIGDYFSDKPRDYSPLLYCWRGGMRSNALAHILRQIGWRARIIGGGYKSFRNFIITDIEEKFSRSDLNFVVLSGQTGVTKTKILHTLRNLGAQILDLEGLANHKGSVLGLPPNAQQPSQKHFETRLWHTISQLDSSKPIFTEAESNRIGNVQCPPALWKKLSQSKVIEVKLPLSKRVDFLLEDYPYFTEQPEKLKKLLKKLTRLRGHDQINQWHTLVDAGNWQAFLASILEDHYDLVYRRAGEEESNYQSPSSTLELPDTSKQSLEQAAQYLLSRV